MMGAFLDALGIAHENGLIQEENVKPDAAKINSAVEKISAEFPKEDVQISSTIAARILKLGGLEESLKGWGLGARGYQSGYGSVRPSSVTSTITTGVSARNTTIV